MSGGESYSKYVAWCEANGLPPAAPLSGKLIDALACGANHEPRYLREDAFAFEPNFSPATPGVGRVQQQLLQSDVDLRERRDGLALDSGLGAIPRPPLEIVARAGEDGVDHAPRVGELVGVEGEGVGNQGFEHRRARRKPLNSIGHFGVGHSVLRRLKAAIKAAFRGGRK